MLLAVLGSGTTIPHADRGCAGYALIADDGSVLIVDCGPGASRRFPSVGIDPRRIVGVVTTHHHADHVGDLPILLFLRNVLEPAVETPWMLLGPRGHEGFVRGLVGTYAAGLASPDDEGVGLRELVDGDDATIGPFRLRAREVAHIPGALGFRIEADARTVAFSGDSGPCAALVDLARAADVAVFECSYASARESRMHLTPRTAAEMASEAGVKSLVLSHFYPECLAVDRESEVRAAGYDGPLTLATDGMRLRVADSSPS